MNRRGFFSKMLNPIPEEYFFGIQIVFLSNAEDNIWENLVRLVKINQESQNANHKVNIYHEVVSNLIDVSFSFEYGYWDFIKNEDDSKEEFESWISAIEESLPTKKYEMVSSEYDVHRISIRKDFIAITLGFLLNKCENHDKIFINLDNIDEDKYNDNATYVSLLEQVKLIDFEFCNSDCLFIRPGNEEDGLSWEDIHGDGWEYLVPIFK